MAKIAGALICLLFLCACGTVQDHRARQMNRDFSPLSIEEKGAALTGVIEPGMSRTGVYVALGSPKDKVSLGGGKEVWNYLGWIDEYGRFRSTADLIFRSTRSLQRMIVTFQDGQVVETSLEPYNKS